MGAKIYLSLFLAISVQGFPNNFDEYYNDQYDIDDSYYDGEDTPINDVDNEITNIHKPTIINNPERLQVDNGMTIRLACNVDKLPVSVPIIWSKEKPYTIIAMGDNIMEDYKDRAAVQIDGKGSVLTIGIAKTEDEGFYKCSVAVSNDDKKNPTLKHDVRIRDIINNRAPPSVDMSTPQFLDVRKGDDVTLACRASGNPAPTVKWTRVDKMMPDGRAEIQEDRVTFTQVSRKHAGTYKCTASNGYGKEAVKEVVVDVNYPPEIEITEMFVHSQAGQDKVELICNVHAHPAPNVIWEKEGNLIENNNRRMRFLNIGSKHTLVISHVKSEDFGKYACKATNNLGSQQKVIELTGHASPAQFKSSASGSSENSFLIEWSSKSFTPITKFKLEIKEKNSNNWKSYTIDAHRDEVTINHWVGKQYLSDLKGATQYVARVSAENDEGWSQFGREWNFATLGAVPSPASVRGSAASLSSAAMMLMSCLVLLWRM